MEPSDTLIFVNRILNLKKIKYIGLDMDHTLIRYHTAQFEALVFKFVIDALIQEKKYPDMLLNFTFDINRAIRGLVIDSENGNILKLNRYGRIKKSYHGSQPLSFSAQQALYHSTYVDLNDPNYMVIDTSFSISFCVLYQQLVDLKDQYPHLLPHYHIMAKDVLHTVDQVHANGLLKKFIGEHIADFIIQDPHLIQRIHTYQQFGKKIFILTNSDYTYTKTLLDYAVTPFLPQGQTWHNLFEYVITFANKPRFFYDNLHFLHIDPETGMMSNVQHHLKPGIYQGGHASAFTAHLNVTGDQILYVGDHIYGDIVRLKKHCNWRTALVVEELGSEIEAQYRASHIEHDIMIAMQTKQTMEQQYIQKLHEDPQNQKAIKQLQHELLSLDQNIATALQTQETFYHPIWGRIFRAGAEESYFAYQVERYACIYMEKLVDLFNASPYTYFRAYRRRLPHD